MTSSMLLKIIYFLSMIILVNGCIDMTEIDLSKSNKPRSPSDNKNQTIDRIRIESHVLAAMKDQIASQSPMRGGSFFGSRNGGEVTIHYFLYDYASKYSSGVYESGENVNNNVEVALSYKDEDNHKPLAQYLGHAHSAPGHMNYVLSQHETALEAFFKDNAQASFYVMSIITMGSESIKNIESHEMKLGDNAKVSFFVKERGQKIRKITQIKTFDSDTISYKRMHSYVSSRAHIQDIIGKFNLGAINAKVVLVDQKELRRLKMPPNTWVFLIDIPQKNITIQSDFSYYYPQRTPVLYCHEISSNQSRTLAKEHMTNWRSNEKNPKNFEEFFGDFITTKCPIR